MFDYSMYRGDFLFSPNAVNDSSYGIDGSYVHSTIQLIVWAIIAKANKKAQTIQ
jgi:hypothetical protein